MRLLNRLKLRFLFRRLVTIRWNLRSMKYVLGIGLVGSKAFILMYT